MNQARLASLLKFGVCLDTETHRTQPGITAPPIVCGSIARHDGQQITGALLTPDQTLDYLIQILAHDELIIVGQNIAFDLLVLAVYALRKRGLDLMPAIFNAYKRERIFDIGIAEQLHAIARGTLRLDPRTNQDLRDPLTNEHKVGYRLSVLVDLVLNRVDAKLNDFYRERYALLEPIPMSWWPFEARQYPVDDVCNTLEVALAQTGHMPSFSAHEWIGGVCRRCRTPYAALSRTTSDVVMCHAIAPRLNLHDLSKQCFAAWAMHLGAAWGFLVDPEALMKLEATTLTHDALGNLTERGRDMKRFIDAGILREDGSEDQSALARMVAVAYGCTGVHEACGGTGKIITQWSKREPIRPLKTKQCVECAATGLDLKSAHVPLTDPSKTFPNGKVQMSRDALGESGDELLMDYGHYKEGAKIRETYVPWLKSGFDANGYQIPLTLFPRVLLETGRAAYGEVVQQLPRKGDVRRCIIARPARVEIVNVPDDYVLRPGEEWVQ